jgi:hypothetical protein
MADMKAHARLAPATNLLWSMFLLIVAASRLDLQVCLACSLTAWHRR